MSDNIASAIACAGDGQIDQAISSIEKVGGPFEVAETYATLVKRIYRERRDITSMIAFAEAAGRFITREAARANDLDATRLKQSARVIAYNAAANCWPGWGDEGVVIEVQHLAAGLKLAHVSLGLVQELDLGQKERGTGHWLIGALELASGRFSDAVTSFSLAEEASLAHGDNARALMAQGYAALAQKLSSQSGDSDQRLSHILDQLRTEGSNEAVFFAEQIIKAEPLLAAFIRRHIA